MEKHTLFSTNTSMDEVQKVLSSICGEVKPKGKKKVLVKYGNSRLQVRKEKDGYIGYVDIPGYLIALYILAAAAVYMAVGIAVVYLLNLKRIGIIPILAGAITLRCLFGTKTKPGEKDLDLLYNKIKERRK